MTDDGTSSLAHRAHCDPHPKAQRYEAQMSSPDLPGSVTERRFCV